MKTRKIISLCCVIALVFCMSASVFSAGPTPTTIDSSEDPVNATAPTKGAKITVGSTLYLPTIECTIDKPTTIIVNPFKMDYKDDGNTEPPTLISAPVKITSTSDIALKVSAQPKAIQVSNSNVKFVPTKAEATAEDLKSPTVCVTMQMGTFEKTDDPAKTADENAADFANAKSTTSVLPITTSTTESISINLPKHDASDEDKKVVGAYTFDGASGGAPWAATDLIQIDVLFDINPIIGNAS